MPLVGSGGEHPVKTVITVVVVTVTEVTVVVNVTEREVWDSD